MQTDPEMTQEQPTTDSTMVSPQWTVPVTSTRVLGVFQIFIGVITCIFGIAVYADLKSHYTGYFGLAFGEGYGYVLPTV